MGYRDDIRHEAEARGIRHLVHFTPFANLVGIVEHGLLPRTELNARGLGYTYTDAWRLDEDLGATSLSISVPNLEMLQSKRRQAPHLPWAILYFDPRVLWTHDCRFCFRSASHNDLRKSTKFRGGPWGFGTMFEDVAPTFTFKGKSYRKETGIPLHRPTRDDAEVQVREGISPQLILGVGVSSPDLAGEAQLLMDRLNKEDGADRKVPFREF
jgi:hypothetical protein